MPTAAESSQLLQPTVVDESPRLNAEAKSRKKPLHEVSHFASQPDKGRHERFLKDAVELLLKEAVFGATNVNSKVLEWRDPKSLAQEISLSMKDEGETHEKLLGLLSDVVKYSVKTGHPHFVNQLFSSLDPYGLVGQWATDALNGSVYTYEVAPVFILMEEEVLHCMREILGWCSNGVDEGDSIFCPGGSMANGYAISCSRFNAFPEVKTKGLHSLPRLSLFTSEDAHYSISKMASLLGIGSDFVHLVKCNSRGQMDPETLESCIRESLDAGEMPFMVSATAGTTVLGAFDPIPEISMICKKYNLWLHVDAAWGGGALMSKKHRHLLSGIDRADSVTWNPHKLLSAPQQCSTFHVRKGRNPDGSPGILSATHSTCATYLFQKDKFYDTSLDTGDKHIQCGRRPDVLKFWFMWKAKGTNGLEKHIDTVFENAAYFTEKIRHREGFKLVVPEPQCTNICFWYIPPSLRGEEGKQDFNEKLHKVAPKIKELMMRSGTMMITYQPLGSLPNFFRLVLQNSGLTHEDMDFFIAEIERLGKDL
ncbi:cysteine sulfinic acid decarboxylase [Hetaerina americana]|uniref:cysteine sulfinic acid decarboxylase n=1 Tax=Hetaerina americana TaxID=62018 RepID=UPI003A7F4C76